MINILRNKGVTLFMVDEKDVSKFICDTGLNIQPKGNVVIEYCWPTGNITLSDSDNLFIECTINDYNLNTLLVKADYIQTWMWREEGPEF